MMRRIAFHRAVLFLMVFFVAGLIPACADLPEEEYYRNRSLIPLGVEQHQEGVLEKGVYVVLSDLYVDKGNTLVLDPGVVMLFKKKTTLIVDGTLVCNGTNAALVTMSSLEKRRYFNPDDTMGSVRWYGIRVAESGNVKMAFTVVQGSDNGLSIENAVNAILDTVNFYDNAVSNFRLGGKIMPVGEGGLVVYTDRTGRRASSTIPANQAPIVRIDWRVPVRVAGVFVGAAGLGTAIYGFVKADANYRKYQGTLSAASADFRKQTLTFDNVGWAGLVCGIIGCAGLSLTFVF